MSSRAGHDRAVLWRSRRDRREREIAMSAGRSWVAAHALLSLSGMSYPIARPSRFVLGPFALLLLGGACSAPVDDPPTDSESELSQCQEVTKWPDAGDRIQYARKTWDAGARVLVAEYSSTPRFESVSTLKWRYAANGRIIAYLAVEQPFQHDYVYDEHDNVVSFKLSYPETSDLLTPSPASVWIGWSNANEYSASGRLTVSTSTPSGRGAGDVGPQRWVFTEDEAGRCIRAETTDVQPPTVVVRTYDDAGRLHSIETSARTTWMQVFTYWDNGQLYTEKVTSDGLGFGGLTVTHDFTSDGGEVVTVDDQQTDIIGERHRVTTRTAACLAIDKAIGSAPDFRCRAQ